MSHIHHHYHSPYKRTLFSFILVSSVMLVGTIGMHLIEQISWMDAFYFMSMIATAQGASYVPQTALGKLFASLMSFVSVGFVVASLGFLFGPFLGKLFKIGQDKLEEEKKLLREKSKDHL
jgi:hypothetical protein